MYVGPHRVQLRQAYSNNLLDATKAFSMTLADPAQVQTVVHTIVHYLVHTIVHTI